jgi:hypothetical protein
MSAAVRRRAHVRLLLAAGALALAPALLAAPAYAASATPTPIASEPPGGATCAPGAPASCGQDQGTSASPTATHARASVGTLPRTGGAPTTLAHTGGGPAGGWGYAGTGLLVGGSLLVLAGRRPRTRRSPQH